MEGYKELPQDFVDRMNTMLGVEAQAFFESFSKERHYGLRRNPLKVSEEAFLDLVPFRLKKVSWAKEGFYYLPEDTPGKHVLHEMGIYYIQEPSAMAVVEILDPKPGECILDLCAAPGGKSTQIAGRMEGKGLLVSNEIVPGRAKILSQNVERMGVKNAVVVNETPDRLATFFPSFFDRIVVDAPCSGEGMFRKDDVAIAEWSSEHVVMCAKRQHMILEEASKMLKPGGVLVYSTCTFAPLENEEAISRFIETHPEFDIEEVEHDPLFTQGRADWCTNAAEGIEATMRLMPYQLDGEGHFIARLRKKGSLYQENEICLQGIKPEKAAESKGKDKDRDRDKDRDKDMDRDKGRDKGKGKGKDKGKDKTGKQNMLSEKTISDFLCGEAGINKEWVETLSDNVTAFGDQIYAVPGQMIPLAGLKVIRPGLHIGTMKKNRIEPTHALALCVKATDVLNTYEISEEDAYRYMHGEGVSCRNENGWVIITYKGYPLGYGKASAGQIKNHYPKGLRK